VSPKILSEDTLTQHICTKTYDQCSMTTVYLGSDLQTNSNTIITALRYK